MVKIWRLSLSLQNSKSKAFQEAVVDVLLGAVINLPLGFVVLALANWIGIIVTNTEQNIQLVIFQSIIFSLVGILRKTYVRLYFHKKYLKNIAQKG